MLDTDQLVEFLINVIRALVVLLVALGVARLARRWVVRIASRSRVNLNTAALLGNLVQVGVVTLGLVFVLPSFGVDWTGLLTLVGAAGLAISLSMQDLLKNYIAGIYILMEQPFRIGDRISVKEVTGVVQGIELRTTLLCTEENLQVVVPNGVVMNEIITNRSASNLQRQVIKVAVRGQNLTEISQEITRTIKDLEGIAPNPTPTTALEKTEEGLAHLRVEFWAPASERAGLTARVVEALQTRFPTAGVTVA
jgi:small-conductance mechanosensitive channel